MNREIMGKPIAILVFCSMSVLTACNQVVEKPDQGDPRLPRVPPDLAAMGKSVQTQYEDLRSTLEQQLDAGGSTPVALAQAWGEFGMWHHSYAYPETGALCYQRAEKSSPNEAQWIYYQAQLLQARGSFREARVRYLEVLDLQPNRFGPLLRLAELELEQRNPDQAASHFEQALSLDSKSAAALFGLGRIAYQKGDAAEAVSLLDAAAEIQPEASRLHYHLAMAYRELGDVERAEGYLALIPGENREHFALPINEPWDRALSKFDRGPAAYRQRAMQALRQDEDRLATEFFGRALAAEPQNVEMKLAYARSLDRIGHRQAAIELLEEALLEHPDHPALNMVLGTKLAQTEDRGRAEEHLQSAVALDPACVQCRQSLALFLRSDSRDKEALEHLESARDLQVAPKNSFDYATVLVGLGREDDAIRALEEDRRLLPEAEPLRLLLARLRATGSARELKNPCLALELATERPAGTIAAAETMAIVHSTLGDFESAVAWQKASVEAAKTQGKRVVHRTQRRLDLYLSGRECLVPWERQERFSLTPVNPPAVPVPPASR